MYTPNATGHITTIAGANYDNKLVIIFGTSTGIIIQVCDVYDIFLMYKYLSYKVKYLNFRTVVILFHI